MPRIAASLVALAAVVSSIAVNTTRYPIVWEMTAPERLACLNEATGPTESTSQSAGASELASTGESDSNAASIAGARTAESASSDVAWQPPDAAESSLTDEPTSVAEASSQYAGYSGYGRAGFLPATGENAAEDAIEADAAELTEDTQTVGSQESLGCQRGQTPLAEDDPDMGTPDYSMASDVSRTPSVRGNHWPAEVVPSAKYAAGMSPGSTQTAQRPSPPLVPVSRGADEQIDQSAPDPASVTETSSGVRELAAAANGRPGAASADHWGSSTPKRLPPVDCVVTLPGRRPTPAAVPPVVYPRTGF